jgi:hypothetical protein
MHEMNTLPWLAILSGTVGLTLIVGGYRPPMMEIQHYQELNKDHLAERLLRRHRRAMLGIMILALALALQTIAQFQH